MTQARRAKTLPSRLQAKPAARDTALDSLVALYLEKHGWLQEARGLAGALWRSGEAVIAVPDGLRAGSTEWQGIVSRVATYERRESGAVETSIQLQLTDVTQLRAANDVIISGSIPLEAGANLVNSAWAMLRAAATTSVRPRPHIAGNFSQRADELAGRARMGHTVEGSYIIPLLMPLTPPAEDSPTQPPMPDMEIERNPYEPAERRVSRTLAEALAAIDRVIVQADREPNLQRLTPMILAGGSRELVAALHRVIADEAVASFEASFSWAGGLREPAGIPERVKIPSEAAPLLQRATQLLRTSRYSADEVITGPIVEVRHKPNDPIGEIAVQTLRRGKSVEVRVLLNRQQLDATYDWARSSRPVVVEGKIRHAPGNPLRIERPSQIYPLDETYLPQVAS